MGTSIVKKNAIVPFCFMVASSVHKLFKPFSKICAKCSLNSDVRACACIWMTSPDLIIFCPQLADQDQHASLSREGWHLLDLVLRQLHATKFYFLTRWQIHRFVKIYPEQQPSHRVRPEKQRPKQWTHQSGCHQQTTGPLLRTGNHCWRREVIENL